MHGLPDGRSAADLEPVARGRVAHLRQLLAAPLLGPGHAPAPKEPQSEPANSAPPAIPKPRRVSTDFVAPVILKSEWTCFYPAASMLLL